MVVIIPARSSDDNVPLVVPEINAQTSRSIKGIIANPNCTTAITAHGAVSVASGVRRERIFASSYQAVSARARKR